MAPGLFDFDTYVRVTLGSGWKGVNGLSPGTNLVLRKVQGKAGSIFYSENGTLTANATSNRLLLYFFSTGASYTPHSGITSGRRGILIEGVKSGVFAKALIVGSTSGGAPRPGYGFASQWNTATAQGGGFGGTAATLSNALPSMIAVTGYGTATWSSFASSNIPPPNTSNLLLGFNF